VTLLRHHAAQWQYSDDGGRDVATGRGVASGVRLSLWMGVLAVVSIASAVLDPSVAGWALLAAALTGAAAVGFFMYTFRVSLTAVDEGLTVRSLASETRIPWADIVDCAPGYYGIRITRRDGSSVNASAVQTPNYAAWFKLESRADEVSAEIRRRTESAAQSSA
jgi:Bacterial PH domain